MNCLREYWLELKTLLNLVISLFYYKEIICCILATKIPKTQSEKTYTMFLLDELVKTINWQAGWCYQFRLQLSLQTVNQ